MRELDGSFQILIMEHSTYYRIITDHFALINNYLQIEYFRAHVTNKTEITKFDNGQLFTVDLIDESRGIKSVVFNEAVNRFYNYIEVSKFSL